MDVNLNPRRLAFDGQDYFFELFEPPLQRLPHHRQSFAPRDLSPSFNLLLFGIRVIHVSIADDSATGENR